MTTTPQSGTGDSASEREYLEGLRYEDKFPDVEAVERIGYLCIQGYPKRICSGCTSACCEPVFAYRPVEDVQRYTVREHASGFEVYDTERRKKVKWFNLHDFVAKEAAEALAAEMNAVDNGGPT